MTRRWPFAVAAAVLVADRVSKRVIETQVSDWEIIRVIPGLFQIVHTRNTGVAFGIFSEQGSGAGRLLLVAFSFAVMALVGHLLWGACRNAKEHWTLAAALALVLGGAAGNLYDRVAFGSVTDFLDFYWRAHHFPVFNLADTAISTGAGLLLVNLWLVRQR